MRPSTRDVFSGPCPFAVFIVNVIAMFICVLQLMFVPKICAMRKLLVSTNGSIIFKTTLSKSRGRDFFLKGGSVVTPQKFDPVLLIKILPGN